MVVERTSRKHAWILIAGMLVACGGEEQASGPSDVDQKAGELTANWHEQIAPIVGEKCVMCHKSGGIAPFSMESYGQAKPFASAMAGAVEAGRMPPFLAQETDSCQPKLPWKNDLRLSPAEKALLRAWADAGAPEGDASKAAPLKAAASVTLEREDIKLQISEPISVEGNKDLHTCVVLDPHIDQASYVTGRLITAGNPKILHHVVSYVLVPEANETKEQLAARVKAASGADVGGRYDCFGGPRLTGVKFEMLDAWAPGGVPNLAPAGTGQPIRAGSLVLLDMHYHPVGAVETDSSTRLGLMLAKEKPAMISRSVLIGNFQEKGLKLEQGEGALIQQSGESKNEFLIPANAVNHVEEMTWTFKLPVGIRISGMGTHMHYVGRDMRVTLEHAAPTPDQDASECLIETPNWDFNWQRGYGYDGTLQELPMISSGDTLRLRCVYDNSKQNRFVLQALADQKRSEPIDVRLGEDTLDEMCLASIGIIYPNVGL